jgi:hypothetical protein
MVALAATGRKYVWIRGQYIRNPRQSDQAIKPGEYSPFCCLFINCAQSIKVPIIVKSGSPRRMAPALRTMRLDLRSVGRGWVPRTFAIGRAGPAYVVRDLRSSWIPEGINWIPMQTIRKPITRLRAVNP